MRDETARIWRSLKSCENDASWRAVRVGGGESTIAGDVDSTMSVSVATAAAMAVAR